MNPNNSEHTSPTPAHKPSMLSRKFIALVMVTIQSTVNAKLTILLCMNNERRMPASHTTVATRSCPSSFDRALRSCLSSYTPSATISSPPSSNTTSFGHTENAPSM